LLGIDRFRRSRRRSAQSEASSQLEDFLEGRLAILKKLAKRSLAWVDAQSVNDVNGDRVPRQTSD